VILLISADQRISIQFVGAGSGQSMQTNGWSNQGEHPHWLGLARDRREADEQQEDEGADHQEDGMAHTVQLAQDGDVLLQIALIHRIHTEPPQAMSRTVRAIVDARVAVSHSSQCHGRGASEERRGDEDSNTHRMLPLYAEVYSNRQVYGEKG
jgi:hypothetical protein